MASKQKRNTRRRRRSRLGPLFKILCAVAVVVAVTMGATVFFQVEAIVVTGNSRYTQEEIVQATGIQIGDNLFHMNKYQIYDQVCAQLPYIEDIQIRRGLPSTILVTITEWDAVAQILPPEPGSVTIPAAVEEVSQEGAQEGEETSEEKPVEIATQAWLISKGGKLLEVAPADSKIRTVSGLTLLSPEAGTQMVLPEEQEKRQDILLTLLEELRQQEMLEGVNSLEIGSTSIKMGYLGRYQVKLPLNGNLDYKLRALGEAVADRENELGDGITGTFDLTQEYYTVVYSPQLE